MCLNLAVYSHFLQANQQNSDLHNCERDVPQCSKNDGPLEPCHQAHGPGPEGLGTVNTAESSLDEPEAPRPLAEIGMLR